MNTQSNAREKNQAGKYQDFLALYCTFEVNTKLGKYSQLHNIK